MLASDANVNLVFIIVIGIPTFFTALGSFLNTIRFERKNDRQHRSNLAQINETKHLLITHAAKLGTIDRRVTDASTGARISDPLPSAPVITSPTERQS